MPSIQELPSNFSTGEIFVKTNKQTKAIETTDVIITKHHGNASKTEPCWGVWGMSQCTGSPCQTAKEKWDVFAAHFWFSPRAQCTKFPCFFLFEDKWTQMLFLVSHMTCLSQVLCWSGALKLLWISPNTLPLGPLVSDLSSSSPPTSQRRKLNSVKFKEGGEHFAIKLLIKEVPTWRR